MVRYRRDQPARMDAAARSVARPEGSHGACQARLGETPLLHVQVIGNGDFRGRGMRIRYAVLRCVWLLCGAGIATAGLAQTPVVEVSVPKGFQAYQVVPPGGVGEFGVDFRNNAGVARLSATFGAMDSAEIVWSQYRFVSVGPSHCRIPTPYLSGPDRFGWVIYTDPIPAQSVLSCRYRVERLGASTAELGLRFCVGDAVQPTSCEPVARFGTFADLDLSLEPLVPSIGEPGVQRVRVSLHNRSARAVASRVAATDCHGFSNPTAPATAFDIESPPLVGCRPAPGAFCGPGLERRAYSLGPVAAGTSASCELHIRSIPRSGLRLVPFALVDDRVVLPDGGIAFDPDRRNESRVIGLDLQLLAAPVPVDPRAVALLAAMLWLALIVRQWRARSR